MKLSQFKAHLESLNHLIFEEVDGTLVPEHFHVTEIGKVQKHFIDCGGKERKETVINFQLWNANDYNHRLHPEKLQHIIDISEKTLQLEDNDIEVEYQSTTIGKYGLEFTGSHFKLVSKFTDCLAKDDCGVPQQKVKVNMGELETASCCDPSSGCC